MRNARKFTTATAAKVMVVKIVVEKVVKKKICSCREKCLKNIVTTVKACCTQMYPGKMNENGGKTKKKPKTKYNTYTKQQRNKNKIQNQIVQKPKRQTEKTATFKEE